MIDRIARLRQKAINFANEQVNPGDHRHWDEVCDNKFAELIIDKCISIADEATSKKQMGGWAIKEYFGREK